PSARGSRCGNCGACGTVNSALSPLPNGLVQSKPAFAPVRLPCSDGSSGTQRKPDATTKSRSAWKRVASAQSICSSENTSTSSSTTNTCFTSPEEQNTPAQAFRSPPGLRWRSDTRTLYMPPDDAVQHTATG